MAAQSVIEMLGERERFTEIEWGVVSYLYEHRSQVADLTIAELARATYSSNGSIMNICKKLGCSGFRDLKYRIIADVESQKYVQSHVNLTTPFKINESPDSIINQMASLHKEAIDFAQLALDATQVSEVVSVIEQADRLFVFGVGDSNITCESFINRLVKINYYAVLATSQYDETTIASTLTRRDAALFVSYSGVNKAFTVPLRTIRKTGAPIIGITANATAAVARYSSHLILLPDLEGDERISTFYSQAAFGYVLNIIYALLYARTVRHTPAIRPC